MVWQSFGLASSLADAAASMKCRCCRRRRFVNAIDKTKYEVVPIGITKDGRWLTAEHAERLLKGKGEDGRGRPRHTDAASGGRSGGDSGRGGAGYGRSRWSFRRNRRGATLDWLRFRPMRICGALPIARLTWMSFSPSCTEPSVKTARFRDCSNWPTSPTSVQACSALPRAWIKTS